MEKINLDAVNTPAPLPPKSPAPLKWVMPSLLVLALVLGVGGGALLGRSLRGQAQSGSPTLDNSVIPSDQSALKVGTIYGSKDEAGFPDKAEGVLVAGGVGGEGSHHLVRVGGVSQNVYLSSSVVDLDTVLGARVQVWGQTMSAKKAGWLMDVGRLKVVELNAPLPE